MKTKRIHTVTLVTLLVIAAFILAACDFGGAPQAASNATSSTPTSAAQPASPTQSTLAPTVAPSPTTTPSPTTAPTQAPASNLLGGEPRAIVRGAFDKLNNAGPYRMKDTTTNTFADQTQTIDTVRELIPPNRTRSTFKPALVNFTEIITIDNVQYYKDLNGKWTKSDKPPTRSNAPNVSDILAKAISDVLLVGPELLNSTPTMVFSMKFNLEVGATFAGIIKVWIGVADGLPRQYDSQGTTTATSGAQAQLQTRIIYEYDKSIKIEPPIP